MKERKRFFKDKWFWAFIVMTVISLVLAVFTWATIEVATDWGNDADSVLAENASLKKKNKKLKKNNKTLTDFVTDNITGDLSESDSSTSSSVSYSINEEATMSSSNERLGLTLTSATKTFNEHGQSLIGSDMKDIAITNEKTVQFTFKYKNYSNTESWLPSIFDFTVYDANGDAATLVNQQDGQDEVAKGRSSQTTFWANFSEPISKGAKVEVDYQGEGLDTPLTFTATVN